ncbi:hypothetical protein HY095_05985 [Candidatus Micrarchaeota archaeon]|nr:hypothetical protein [Candidatus Micrarchaeota archaeon]
MDNRKKKAGKKIENRGKGMRCAVGQWAARQRAGIKKCLKLGIREK